MITKDRRGLSEAIEYLKSAMPVRLITDRLYMLAKCDGKVESLGYSLRREARKPDNTNRVNVSYSPDESGKLIAYYTYNTDYTSPKRTANRARWFFYTRKYTNVPSPLFHSLEDLKADKNYTDNCHVWTGSYSCPILVEVTK